MPQDRFLVPTWYRTPTQPAEVYVGLNNNRSGTGYVRPVAKFTRNPRSKGTEYIATGPDGTVVGTYARLVRAFEVQDAGDDTDEAVMVLHEFQARDLLDRRVRRLMG